MSYLVLLGSTIAAADTGAAFAAGNMATAAFMCIVTIVGAYSVSKMN